jgi:3-methyladenine DNA glycosylase AlkD
VAEPIYERRFAAVELLVAARAQLTSKHVALVEKLLREAKTWALVDPLATDVAGAIADGKTLDRWAKDGDFWIRRAALLAHLRELCDGGGDFERFARYADMMLDENEFFIRKAIGWVLRETGKRRPELVRAWIAPRVGAPRG